MESARRIKFGSSLLGEENLQENLSRVCEFRSLVKNRLILIAQVYTHKQKFDFGLTNLRFVFWFIKRISSKKISSYHFVCVLEYPYTIELQICLNNLFLYLWSVEKN